MLGRYPAGIAVLLLCLWMILDAQSIVYAQAPYRDIDAQGVRKIMVAVPDLDMQTAVSGFTGTSLAQLLGQAIDLHGFVKVSDSKVYGGSRNMDWKILAVDFVILADVRPNSAGVELAAQILDGATNAVLTTRSYKGAAGQMEEMVLRLCDGIIKDITGEEGISHTRIAYVSDATGRKEVYISDILGRHPRQVTKHRALCVSPRFTPDGQHLTYSTYHRGNQDLYITDLRQNTSTRSLSRRKGLNMAPAFMPDGSNLVVTLSMNGNPDLYLMNRQGQIREQLTSGAGINVSPSFAPDGQNLAFVSDRSGKPQLYVMNMANRQPKRLQTGCSESTEPAWSPKGNEIAFTCLKEGRYWLAVIGANGGNVQLLSGAGTGNFESPSWSPDGRLIAVTKKSGSRSVICVVGRLGKEIRPLFTIKGNQTSPQWSGRLH